MQSAEKSGSRVVDTKTNRSCLHESGSRLVDTKTNRSCLRESGSRLGRYRDQQVMHA